MSMTPNRPYLIRAFFEWIVDNECTPYVSVDAYYPEVSVPQDYVNDGQIVLNLAPRAITELTMDNKAIAFSTRFGGVPTSIYLPINAITGIYARENGQGMVFDVEDHPAPTASAPKPVEVVETKVDPDKPKPPSGGGSSSSKKRPSLRIIK